MAVKRNFDYILSIVLVVALVVGVTVALRRGPAHEAPVNKETPQTAQRPVKTLPDTWFFTADDRKVTLADFKGKVILVNLWATWCPPCVVELPALDNLQAALKDKDFKIIAISMDQAPISTVTGFLQGRDITHLDVYYDKDKQIPLKWHYDGLPVSFLLDKNGVLIQQYEGPQAWDKGPIFEKIAGLFK